MNKLKTTQIVKKVNTTTKVISNTTKQMVGQVADKAVDLVGAVKDNFGKDVEELVEWVKNRNQEIKQEEFEIQPNSMPTLVKVISGGEDQINLLPEDEKKKYINYFKHNASRITLLTAINPLFGLGTAGAEMAASGIISTKASLGTAAAGVGLMGASAAAATITPISYFAWSAMKTVLPPLRILGLGMAVFGSSAALFNTIQKLPQGKLIVEVFDKTQIELNECYDKFEANLYVFDSYLSEKMTVAANAIRDVSKRIAVSIDDAVHSDQNMRLMQYQEIVLNQHKALVEMETTFSDLMKAYSIPLEENRVLAQKIEQYKANMQLIVCGSEYLK